MAITPVKARLVQVLRNQGQPIQQFLSVATWIDVVAVSGTHAEYNIPDGAAMLRITPTSAAGATYGNVNDTAVVPAGGVTNGTGSFPIPAAGLCIVVNPNTTLSLVSAAGGFCTIEVWV